ncbi:CoA transferase [Mycolicibacterium pulveris]|uniref:CoA transferase n=1 Tax=Mycolicibacterium pulveris TaxID=36813 RepID=A0A7I7USM6_MYCPV|nr:CoA transferase [Mycolicibacterium pulveris]MCV6983205.1 CoA transferase [Mycolicibacterium pulveris]BBY83076.1 CoA transferase [Mycolicibacterium pulveris]
MSVGQEKGLEDQSDDRNLPLSDVRVLDLTGSYAGPTATMLLADMGASVVKVEDPHGDDTRRWGPPFVNGASTWFLSANRNKRGVCLDLKTSEGAEALQRLLAASDVLITSFNPSKLDRLGLAPDEVTQRHPDLVYCLISGFGLDGPDSALSGYDLIAQARSGLMSVTGASPDSPQRVSTALSDSVAGLVASFAIACAVYHQRRTGHGDVVDISLLDSALFLMAPRVAAFLAGAEEPRPCGATDSVLTPYQSFATKDRPIVVAAGNDMMWRRLCSALGDDQLAADPELATTAGRQRNRPRVVATVAEHLRRRPATEWLARFAELGVPSSAIHTLTEVVNDPQLEYRESIIKADHPIAGPTEMVGPPWRLRSHPSRDIRLPAPGLGEHTGEVLAELNPDT